MGAACGEYGCAHVTLPPGRPVRPGAPNRLTSLQVTTLFKELKPKVPSLKAFNFPHKSMLNTFSNHTLERRRWEPAPCRARGSEKRDPPFAPLRSHLFARCAS